MSDISLHADHPVDELPDYVRGCAPDAEAIDRHLVQCETCRAEVEVLRALVDSGPELLSDVERQRVFRAFDERRATPVSATGPVNPRWISRTWRVAATIALLLTGIGVWRVVQSRPAASDWSPELALEGWRRDLAELEIGPGDVRVAFGFDVADEIQWEDLEGLDPYDVIAPWEEN